MFIVVVLTDGKKAVQETEVHLHNKKLFHAQVVMYFYLVKICSQIQKSGSKVSFPVHLFATDINRMNHFSIGIIKTLIQSSCL